MRGTRIGVSLLALAACASDAVAPGSDEGPSSEPLEAGSTVPPVSTDAGCDACDPFPETCVDGAFCRTGIDLTPRQVLLSVVARGESDIWIGGALGTVLHYEGRTWSAEAMPWKETFGALLLRGPEEIWAGAALASSYARDAKLPTDAGPGGWVSIGAAGMERTIRDLWSKGTASWVWAGLDEAKDLNGDPEVPLVRIRRNGSALEVEAQASVPRGAINGIDGLSTSEVWAVGDRGAAYRITAADADTPLLEQINTYTTQSLDDVSVAPNGVAWAVGTVGTVRRYRGPELGWERIDVPTSVRLRGVHAIADDDVWIVGDAATILHFDGTRWSRVPVAGLDGVRPDLRAITSVTAGHLIVVGERIVLELRSKKGDRP